jgi:hypothetical protein
MTPPPDTAEHHCPRCGQMTRPRGDQPRFCANCGQRLTPLHERVHQALSPRARAPGAAVASLVLGICSVAVCAPLGWIAVPLGMVARKRIEESEGRLAGKGLAMAGIVLGIIANVLWVLICLGTLV